MAANPKIMVATCTPQPSTSSSRTRGQELCSHPRLCPSRAPCDREGQEQRTSSLRAGRNTSQHTGIAPLPRAPSSGHSDRAQATPAKTAIIQHVANV